MMFTNVVDIPVRWLVAVINLTPRSLCLCICAHVRVYACVFMCVHANVYGALGVMISRSIRNPHDHNSDYNVLWTECNSKSRLAQYGICSATACPLCPNNLTTLITRLARLLSSIWATNVQVINTMLPEQ